MNVPVDEKVGERPKTDFKLFRIGRATLWFFCRVFYRFEAIDADVVPKTGGLILVANHSSFLDIPASGIGIVRFTTFVARESLMRIPILGWLIRHWGAVPIRRGASDTAAIRDIVDAAKRGEAVVMFPEGTRSPDGELRELRAGVILAARRARVPIVVAGIAGTFEIFPRTRRVPRLRGKMVVAYGAPLELSAAHREGESDLDRVRREIEAQMVRARARWSQRMRRPYPAALHVSSTPPNTSSIPVSPSRDGA